MERASEDSELTAQLIALQKEQSKATDRALYMGWTPETMAEYDKRSELIRLIIARLKTNL